MKTNILILMLVITGFPACNKTSMDTKEAPNYNIFGKWVNVNETADTLEVYREGDRQIMFDNSLYLRINMAIWTNYDNFKKEFADLTDTSIMVREYKPAGSFQYYGFSWKDAGNKFSIQVQAIRPYITAPAYLNYMRIK